MNLKWFENGIFISFIVAGFLALGLGAETWSNSLSRIPSIIKIDASEGRVKITDAGGDHRSDSPESFDETGLVRSPEHQALMSNPEILGDDNLLYRSLVELAERENTSPGLLNDLGVVGIRSNRYDEAIIYLRKGLLLHPDYARAHYNLGIAFANQDLYSESERAYLKALELNKGYQSAAISLGVLHLNHAELDKAKASFEMASSISSGENRARALRLLGTTLLRLEETEMAVSTLRRAVEYNPRDALAWLELGTALSGLEGSEQETTETLEKARVLNDGSAETHYRFGVFYTRTGLWKKAISSLQNALHREPTHIEARVRLAELFEKHGDMEAAISHFGWLAANLTDPNDAATYGALVAEYENRSDEAISLLQAALDENGPVNAQLLKKLGLLLRRKSHFEAALNIYDRYIRGFPLDSDAYVGAIGASLSLENQDLAQQYLSGGISNQPGDPNIWFMQGRLFDSKGDVDGAIRSYEACLALDIESRKCALNLAVLKRATGDDVRVIELYQKILAHSPNYVPARFNLALAFRRSGSSKDAAKQYERILDLDQDNIKSRLNLAVIRKAEGRLDEAEMLLRDGLDIDPSHVSARFNLALLLGKRGNLSGKIEELQRVVRLDSKFDKGWRSLARSLAKGGRIEESVVAWREAIRLNSKQAIPFALALADELAVSGLLESSTALREAVKLSTVDSVEPVKVSKEKVEHVNGQS